MGVWRGGSSERIVNRVGGSAGQRRIGAWRCTPTARAAEALTDGFEHALEALEPLANFPVGHPGVWIQAFGQHAQLVPGSRIRHLAGDSRDHLGVSSANADQAFGSKRAMDR